MSFGSGGFSFGSGNNNNQQQQQQQQTSGFGFGSSTNNTPAFGATSNTGFGSTSTTTNPFSGSTFGANTGATGGFGTQQSTSLFGGNKTSTFGGSGTTLFGGNSTTPSNTFGGGGFGSTNTATNNSSPFGTNNANNNASSGFSFGGNKPAFGSNTTTAPLFGQGGTGTTGTFGASSGFGNAGSGTALSQQAVPPSEGTAITPFAPFTEKDSPSGNATNSFQSIVFQQPYQKYSFEELRLADYNAGRRYGNGSGQAGAFGTSTFGGGGFGSNPTGGFGASTTNPFGATGSSSTLGGGTQSTGFGSNLFGNNNKPQTTSTGLFGQQSTAATAGGLFGTTGGTTGGTAGFGGGTTTGFGNSNSNSLFGTQPATKPTLFSGNTSTTTGNGFSFGNNNSSTTTGGGLFGNAGNTNTLGATTQQPASNPFGGFGSTQNTAQPKSLFGGPQPGGFGTSTTQGQQGGGLFGNTNANNNPSGTSTGLFGNAANTANQGGLFGSTNNNTGGGLFGNNNNANTSNQNKGLFGGGTFGNPQPANAGSSLFGNANNSTQSQPTSLFGGSTTTGGFGFGASNTANKPATTSLFGGNQSTNTGGLFGGNQSNNSGGGLFGNTQNTMQNSLQQQDGPKHASQLESSPYSQSSIWTGLPPATPQNSGPLLTPVTASLQLKESASKPPTLRLQQSRLITPTTRRAGPGYGFSYSTYGSPSSAASTPGGGGLSTSMFQSRGFTGGSFGGSFSRGLKQSTSLTNMRGQYATESDGVFSPGALTPSSTRYSGGSLRRLHIDRSLRTDLFSRPTQPALPAPTASTASTASTANGAASKSTLNGESAVEQPNKLKKRVSFDKDLITGSHESSLNGETGALVRTEPEEIEEPEMEEPRGRRGKPSNVSTTESDKGRGKELAAVPEDRVSDNVFSSLRSPAPSEVLAKPDPKPGAYYMKPSRAEMSKMPRDKLQRFTNFEVGRQGCGHVIFNGSVDLTTIPLDDIYDKIVEIRVRSITVYPESSSKPPQGKGLNVPSTLYIENSWPRSRNIPSSATSGPIFDKHVNRLKKMAGTEFISYSVSTGIWIFKVPHYTRYGLDYDDDDEDLGSSLPPPPDSALASNSGPNSAERSAMDMDVETAEDSDPEDDTFAFKRSIVPGGFGRQSMIENEPEDVHEIASPDESDMSEDEVSDHEMSMAGQFPHADPVSMFQSPQKSILKGRLGTPGKPLIDLDGDWADQLQRTISPRKQNRETLREAQSKVLLDRVYEPLKPQPTTNRVDFRNSIDVMNSLFGKHEERMAAGKKKEVAAPDFEFPYSKRAKLFNNDQSEMSKADRAFHASFKPKWTSAGQLLFSGTPSETADHPWEWIDSQLQSDSNGHLILSSLRGERQNHIMELQSLLSQTTVSVQDNVPLIHHKSVPFSTYCEQLRRSKGSKQGDGFGPEYELYELAHVLFDDYEDEFTQGLGTQQRIDFESRIRKDRLSKYLSAQVWKRHSQDIRDAEKGSPEEAAILHLTGKDIKGACQMLKTAKDYHLMLLVAQIEQADKRFQKDVEAQISAWKEQNIISEISESVRALYEILAGNTFISRGRESGPLEDRSSTFSISESFNLDWMQAFCLCLWYGTHKNGTIEEAVREFAGALEKHQETAFPYADGFADGDQESPLWVLLKLYDSTKGSIGLEPPVLPQALSALSAGFDNRVTFNLHHSITSRLPKLEVDSEKADLLAVELAFQLSASGSYLGAAFALLHIRDSAQRESSVRELLTQHAASLPDEPSDPNVFDDARHTWDALTLGLKIPSSWIFQAKAIFARSLNDSLHELGYLVLAEQWSSAHECLCRRVAPRTIIDEDWVTLQSVLHQFADSVEERISDWSRGGAIYSDFVAVVENKSVKHKAAILKRLQSSLADMGQRFKARGSDLTAGGVEELEERVACKEMSWRVAELLDNEDQVSKTSILDLPLTADARLYQTRNMSVEYYRALMVAAR